MQKVRWAGIDEAGYGPNLGPLVMTAVVAEAPEGTVVDVWNDLSNTVGRAGTPSNRLAIDDSKLIYKAGVGRSALDAGVLALLNAIGRPMPSTFGELLQALETGSLEEAELTPWIDSDPLWKAPPLPCLDPFAQVPWRLVDVRAVVVGPARFNAGLNATGSKATVHFQAFRGLLDRLWRDTTVDCSTKVVGDKHGGRHYYLDLLVDAFPDAWIDRGPEGPELSRYVIRQGGRRLELSLRPKADSGDGLVALASMVAKSVREHWMDAFNTYWARRIPHLKATAGYPQDALRFRREIEAASTVPDPDLWWRRK